jgi:hypothetical protein
MFNISQHRHIKDIKIRGWLTAQEKWHHYAVCTYSVTSICSNRTFTISIPRLTLSRFLVWLPATLTVPFWMSCSTMEGNVEIDLDASSKSLTYNR